MAFNLFAQILKVDEAQRLVIGRAVQEVPDRADEIFDYETSKPYFEAWSKSYADQTDGESVGNLRSMHGKTVAGKLVKIEFNDADKAIDVQAKVVDDNEWNKVLEGCYTGFSIGGKYVGNGTAEKVDGRDIKRYTADPSELSLVDAPCIPTAKFFDIVKADGATLQKAFVEPAPAVKTEAELVDDLLVVMNEKGIPMSELIEIAKREFSAKEREAAAKSGEALKDGSFPIKTVSDLENAVSAYGRAKDKEAAKAHIIKRAKALGATDKLPADWEGSTKKEKADKPAMKKGMWNVQDFAACLSSIACIARSAQWELEGENDGSPVPMALRNWFADGVAIFKEMTEEETKELMQELKDGAGIGPDDEIEIVLEMAAKLGSLQKRLADPALSAADLLKIAGEHGEEVTAAALADIPELAKRIMTKAKEGYSAADMDRLQAIHDHIADMGDFCGDDDEDEDHEKSHKAELQKNADLVKTVEELTKRVKELEAQPMLSPVALAALKGKIVNVTKEQDSAQVIKQTPDSIDPESLTLDYEHDDLIRDFDGSVDVRMSKYIKAQKLQREQAR